MAGVDAGTARLFCLRHAESENVVRQQAGTMPAARLTARGRGQAAAAAGLLRDQQAGMIDASDAVRSPETAEVIAAALGLDVAVMPALSEVAIGTREGAADPATC